MSTIALRSVSEVDASGKVVFLRTSLNVPLTADGAVADLYRLKRAVPTIEHLAKQGAKILLVGYIGRKGETLEPVAKAFETLLPHIPLRFTKTRAHELAGEIAQMPQGSCLMLENMRLEEGEEKNDPEFAKTLASLAQLFVNDAFAEAHRPYASNLGVASLVPSYAGFLFQEEVRRLCEALTPPEASLAIVGGAKFETKQPLVEKLLAVYPQVLLGGALASDLLKARGWTIGESLISGIPIPTNIASNERLHEPVDLTVASKEETASRESNTADVRHNEHIVDIGPQTAKLWAQKILDSSFVVWNGPVGLCEKGYNQGTNALAQALVDGKARAVIGGGDTDAAVSQFTFDPERIFVSTGGGAMLEFIAHGGSLPTVDVLKKS